MSNALSAPTRVPRRLHPPVLRRARRFWWNLRFALIAYRRWDFCWKYAWQAADANDDAFEEGETPMEAVLVEESYAD